MRKTTIFFLTIILISCSTRNQNKTLKPLIEKTKQEIVDYNVGLKFINDYTQLCNDLILNSDSTTSIRSNIKNWINKNELLSSQFKNRYNFILDSAEQASPETGLDFDPIFDAQDFPDKGFTIYEIDSINHFVKVKDIEMDEYTLTLKVENKNNTTFVDGVGIINMPKWTMRK